MTAEARVPAFHPGGLQGEFSEKKEHMGQGGGPIQTEVKVHFVKPHDPTQR